MTSKFHYFADSGAPVSSLSAKEHFDQLTAKEKLYAHYFSKAAHLGSRIILRQVSPESEAIFDLIRAFYNAVDGDWALLVSRIGLTEEEQTHLIEYFSMFLSNLGNYKSFGDSKFVPRISEEKFAFAAKITPEIAAQFETVKEQIYSTEPASTTLLGFPEKGHVTSYYFGSVTKKEIDAIHDAVGRKILPENTRLSKDADGNLTLLIASHVDNDGAKAAYGENVLPTEFDVPALGDGVKVLVKYGDHARELGLIANSLEKAIEYAENANQTEMLKAYVDSFRNGSLQSHKESQKYWVKDIGPNVETNIGFIETYRDPAGIRGEWEGLIAMVNKERTKKFGELVNGAKKYITKLPWEKEFEKDKFTPPDFTSLEVMTFAGSGIPAGINIPNYDDIRQTVGFKNVSLGNVLSAKSSNEKIPFIRDQDLKVYEDLRNPAFEVQVGIHELLGHGSGKLLAETSDGVFNFDNNNPPISPIDSKPVTTYYKPGQTWGSVFGAIAGSYEECRAECVAMYLTVDKELLQIFGHTEDADDVIFVSYLQMARAGLVALEFWDPVTTKWGQPHVQARFSILKAFLEYGDKSFVKLNYTKDDFSDLEIELDRSKILTHGHPAIKEYLQKLHVYKSSADVANGTQLYNQTTSVSKELARFRDIVIQKKLPRRQFVQGNTFLNQDGSVEYREYEESSVGLIRSFVDREV
ncbi:peptidase family M49-domain-containing protein [Lipomyces japonicus]|uniref:peptidase family M49-domain-containing protein n=1 Tax=Lipomyces japonicus TaxID=56871 RepID=UPI0034CDE917